VIRYGEHEMSLVSGDRAGFQRDITIVFVQWQRREDRTAWSN
jgi:hypothetical protein